eukprot:TRINITY_DN21769_c0_g1_i1.p1 TRINITY_DN21769_c0_g1~~TRINITY_DN21769_c0_g1_i1.p1  ORF type:complete len:247 (+),score=76.04 TRINITY_DN21769_c0_g1_i1:192-932(+)
MEVEERQQGECIGGSKEELNSNEDDFGDFEDFEDTTTSWGDHEETPSRVEPTIQHSVQSILTSIEPKVLTVIASSFHFQLVDKDNNSEKPLSPSPEGTNSLSEDPLWNHLHSNRESLNDFTWSSSKSNSNLMASLAIDSRNSLFDGKWKSRTLPSFQESNPKLLEPTKVETKANTDNKKDEELSVLPVEFDWKNSGLTDPLENSQDNSSQISRSEKTSSIIDSFPLLNFMQSSTLIFPINGVDSKL